MGSVRLDAAEAANFAKDGFLQWNRPVFAPDRFADLKALFEDLLSTHGEDGLDVIHFRETRLLDFLLADDVLDLVEPLVGPDIGLWSSHFISKPARTGKPTPWHEDSAYWEGRISTMDNIVTVWLALDATDAENGSMGVLPGTHRGGDFVYEEVPLTGQVFDRQIKPESLDLARARHFQLQPNQCSLHDARIVHGAGANTSDRRRAGYTMRYFPTTSRVYPQANPGHHIWLARGSDRAGNQYVNAHPWSTLV